MVDFLSKRQDITWKSPSGKVFTIKTLESGYSRKHIGDVKENPKTTYTSSSSSSSGKKGSHNSSGVSTSTSKKRVGDSNDTFSDLGIGGKDVSLDCLFIGDNHDIESKAFADALCEVGKSKLRLAYGDEFTVNVLNFSVKNTLTEQINMTTVSVNFHQTAATTYPDSSSSDAKQVESAVADTNTIAAENFETAADAASESQTRIGRFKDSYNKMMSKVSNALAAANSVSVKSILTDIAGQDVMSNAYTMTSQLQIAISQAVGLSYKVSRLQSGFTLPDNLATIKSSLASLLGGLKVSGTKYPLTTEQLDTLKINDTTAQAVIAAMAQNITQTEYTTRKEAVSAVNDFFELADDWNNYLENEYQKIDNLSDAFDRDSGINEVVLTAINAVIEKSYELKVEKTLILTEDESTVNIAYNNYPAEFAIDPEGAIEYLINSNGWGGDMFYLLPKGTEVKLYV